MPCCKAVSSTFVVHLRCGRLTKTKTCDFPAAWDTRLHSRFGNTTDPTASLFLGRSQAAGTYINVRSVVTSPKAGYPSRHPTCKRPRAPLKTHPAVCVPRWESMFKQSIFGDASHRLVSMCKQHQSIPCQLTESSRFICASPTTSFTPSSLKTSRRRTTSFAPPSLKTSR